MAASIKSAARGGGGGGGASSSSSIAAFDAARSGRRVAAVVVSAHRHAAAASAGSCAAGSSGLDTQRRRRQHHHHQQLQRSDRAVRVVTTAAAASSSYAAAVADSPPESADVVVIGAGLAGLHAAALLQRRGGAGTVALLEAGDGPGGRVRTDVHPEGYLLDRGFQIFLTGYPYARDEALDFEALRLRPFYAGARVRFQGAWHTVADPLRHPVDGLLSLLNPIGSPIDKVNVGLFRVKSLFGSLDALLSQPETTTAERLASEGFSEAIVDRFFRPFLGGIFFDRQLGTSSRLFSFVMRMLATGQNCLPERGIGAVSDQLASRLAPGSLVLGARVERIERADGGGEGGGGHRVVLASGRTVTARRVVVATEGPEAARLLGDGLRSSASPSKAEPGVGTCCLYFAADAPPFPDNVLYLDGEGGGGGGNKVVNNACFPSTVSPTYAPPGKALASVSVIGTRPEMDDAALEAAVREELGGWFGREEVAGWRHLRTYRIPFAQPSQSPPTDLSRPVSLGGGLFVCGDHRDTATFEGALVSGRRAAEAVLAEAAAAAAGQK